MVRRVRNLKELNSLQQRILKDPLILSNIILDAEKLTGNRINTLEVYEVENYLINNLEALCINEVLKDVRSNKLVSYKINAILQFNDDNYRINEWFTLNKINDYFFDWEVMEEHDYFIDEVI